MKRVKKILITFILLISIILIYFNTNSYITSYKWKYRNGFNVGDWVELDKENNNYKVVICFGKLIIIKNLDGTKHGYYINKEKIK